MNYKRLLPLALLAGALVPLSVYGVNTGLNRIRIAQASQAAITSAAQSAFAGLTAVQTEIMNCKLPVTGKQPIASTRVRTLTPDGSMSEIIRLAGSDHAVGTIRRADGVFIKTFEHLKSKSSFQTPTKGDLYKASNRDPGTDCINTFFGSPSPGNERKIGEETILGHRTIKTLIESSDRRRTSWMAPGLGCFEMQALLEFYDPKQPGVIAQNSFIQTESLTLGPVDPAMFEAPGLTERKPSEITMEGFVYSFRNLGHTEEVARKMAADRFAKTRGATELDARSEQIKLIR